MEINLSRTLEEYLEAIYAIKYEEKKKVVRVKDIAKRMKVSMPSVTDALTRLSKLGLIDYEKREYIDLTEEGEKIAKDLYEKEKFLADFLKRFLFVAKEIAEEEACKLEHDLSRETTDMLIKFVNFIEKCYGNEILNKFKKFIESGEC